MKYKDRGIEITGDETDVVEEIMSIKGCNKETATALIAKYQADEEMFNDIIAKIDNAGLLELRIAIKYLAGKLTQG